MKRILLFGIFTFCLCSASVGQVVSHRMKFHYRLTQKQLEQLADIKTQSYPLYLTSTGSTNKTTSTLVQDTFRLCPQAGVVQVLVGNADATGALSIDPWQIIDHRVNKFADKADKDDEDPCYESKAQTALLGGKRIRNLQTLNAATKTGLKMQLPARTVVGNPVTGPVLHYQAIIVGINAIAIKTRPEVTTYTGTKVNSAFVAGASLGPGVGKSFGWTRFTHRSSNSYSVTVGGTVGFSAAKLKDEPLTRFVDVTRLPSNFVFSPAGTLILARNDIGIILALGADHMTGNAASAWAYQNKLFFGFGIAAGLKL